ncbi:MAG: hypothetical protein HC857_11915 [Synechococcales cyanobacterium RU_4_20]|nr:hypothetical protein [Synechococcales cyanobacterium RU_4_20]NJR70520.1 hypothetical protein [Synechococcales cyanobacterium CRU_2_2]
MKDLLMALWHILRQYPGFLQIEIAIYRRARLRCNYLEEIHPEISQKAGFTYDLSWLGELETTYGN